MHAFCIPGAELWGACAQLREAAECMPSLLVLDDLEMLCPAPADTPDAEAAAAGSAALVAWLRAAVREYHARPDGRAPLPGQHPWCSLHYFISPTQRPAP